MFTASWQVVHTAQEMHLIDIFAAKTWIAKYKKKIKMEAETPQQRKTSQIP